MLTKCVNCEFFVRHDDEFCLNCGIKNPSQKRNEKLKRDSLFYIVLQSDIFKLAFSFALTFIFIYFIADFAVVNFIYLRSYILYAAFIVWLVLFLILFLFSRTWNFLEESKEIIKNKNNLSSREKTIVRRLSELSSRGEKIDSVLDKIKITDGQNLQEVRRKLLDAREIVISQFARYEIQKRKIELVRLQNGVSPFLFDLQNLNDFETEKGLAVIEEKKFEIEKIRRELTRYDAIEFPARALPEKQNFLGQLDETENSCEKLREGLLARAAMRALKGVRPIEENLQMPPARDLAHAAETFNIQTALTDFSESFDELEREYKRLKLENQISEKILNG